MKPILLFGFLSVLFFSCNSDKNEEEEKDIYVSHQLVIRPLTEHVYLHTSFLETQSYGRVPCNGIVVMDDGEAIIIDSPTTEESSIELLDWLKKEKVKVKGVVPTHFHVDCVAGLEYFHKENIKSYGSQHTAHLTDSIHFTAPKIVFKDTLTLNVDDHKILLKFEGAGHTHDNIVAYIPSDKVLFGGCLVKAKGWGKGNLEDADTTEWANSVMKTMLDFPEVEIVVPGHGGVGDISLLENTIKMFKQ
ncbi:subclass B1 metallo-beta-lactamase [Flammeovirga aprica]|uniref:beta-lactamase n=1 Tax=Flammeovirga aprica JL-4 TaxID=694437 RepID=A0A7X9P0Z3_9BACT|nr:subclass B1 metallo-beta-lactamase [Flammeovirga aprica]NME67554.1 subclass B1 metallo-beta-lactamase [Flammeovirga aprica JL-4]